MYSFEKNADSEIFFLEETYDTGVRVNTVYHNEWLGRLRKGP